MARKLLPSWGDKNVVPIRDREPSAERLFLELKRRAEGKRGSVSQFCLLNRALSSYFVSIDARACVSVLAFASIASICLPVVMIHAFKSTSLRMELGRSGRERAGDREGSATCSSTAARDARCAESGAKREANRDDEEIYRNQRQQTMSGMTRAHATNIEKRGWTQSNGSHAAASSGGGDGGRSRAQNDSARDTNTSDQMIPNRNKHNHVNFLRGTQ